MHNRFKLTFPGTVVETVPQPFYRATPAMLRSLIDFILPVNTIIQRYDHADPNEMYPGTTWERIDNAFLWATTSGGTIGHRDGEQTVKLDVNHMPSHTHDLKLASSNNTGNASTNQIAVGRETGTIYTNANAVVAKGSGAAHNNMPPYIQVSAWRRTA
jgi:hypothetical protein